MRASTTEGTPVLPGNSTIRWGSGLVAHSEQEHEDEPTPLFSENISSLPEPKSVITPSLATLEEVFSAWIYFENLYFPLLRHPPLSGAATRTISYGKRYGLVRSPER